MSYDFPTGVVPRLGGFHPPRPHRTHGVLVGLSGRPRAGKDTAAEHLVASHGFVRVAFADPLRHFVYGLLEIEKNLSWDSIKDDPRPELGGKTPREAMQTLGTEWGRNMIHKDLWLDTAKRKVKKYLESGISVVVSDVRFDNEAEMVRELGGKVLRIVRPDHEITTSTHVAEAGIKPDLVDHIVLNDTTPMGLGYRVSGLVF